ncbi:MAG: hypothetical protein R3E68_09445 [Burkholderiaceae bacterium]
MAGLTLLRQTSTGSGADSSRSIYAKARACVTEAKRGIVVIRMVFVLMATLLVSACGGGGGTGPRPEKGVFTGFAGQFDWENINNEGIGDGADGDGGFGVGGALGQFRGALVIARFPDGTELGRALTDDVNGMVTVKPGRSYEGPMLLEIQGQPGATYFEEGKNAYVPFGPGRVLHALIGRIDRNVGITPFSEAAYRLAVHCQSAQGGVEVCGTRFGQSNGTLPATAAIQAAGQSVRSTVNQQFPAALQIDDVNRLPFIVNDQTGPGAVATDQRGRYGLVNIAFSKQAAMYNSQAESPTLLATEQLSKDLLDGRLDGQQDGTSTAPANQRTYDPHSLATELASALAQQTSRYGNSAALASLPSIVAFGNVRYDGYYFDMRIGASGATDTVAVATETASTERTPGQVTTYVGPQNNERGFMVYGNMGSGSMFIKTDAADSNGQVRVVGNNVNGELGTGTAGQQAETATTISLPGVLTHASGGFGHTLARFADGSVYALGDNAYGQLGQGPGAASRITTPTRVNLPAGALSVAATSAGSFALLENGQVHSWGSGWGFGSLGNATADGTQASPAPVLQTGGAVLTDVTQIAARDNDAVALKRDGSVWTWGSFSQALAGTAPFGIQPGETVATRLQGLPADARVRKVLTEQGISLALSDAPGAPGAVYTWGVYFDITANDFLYDQQPVRVLNLPPVRDVMPGGFIGYGQRPYDRLTAMAIDYSGRLWKIRGRVAERYDPADPIAQRRPQGQAPRPDCASCHTVREATTPALPTTGPACILPVFGLNTHLELVNSASDCAGCHNGGALSTGATLAPLTCVPPVLPPPPTPVNATPLSGQCSLPVGHIVTPAGAFCASCHSGVIIAPLACSPDEAVLPPPSATTASVDGATDDVAPITGAIGNGGITDDTRPVLTGALSAPLVTGESVRVLRDGTDVGAALVSGTTWQFEVPVLAQGNYQFTARVLNAGGASGAQGTPFAITVSTTGPSKTVTITSLVDNVAPQTGAVTAGGKTNDPSLLVNYTLSAALTNNEVVRLTRNGATIAMQAPSGTSGSFTDAGLTTGSPEGTLYQYQAVVESGSGVQGVASPQFPVTFDNQAPATPIVASVSANFRTRPT